MLCTVGWCCAQQTETQGRLCLHRCCPDAAAPDAGPEGSILAGTFRLFFYLFVFFLGGIEHAQYSLSLYFNLTSSKWSVNSIRVVDFFGFFWSFGFFFVLFTTTWLHSPTPKQVLHIQGPLRTAVWCIIICDLTTHVWEFCCASQSTKTTAGRLLTQHCIVTAPIPKSHQWPCTYQLI